MVVFGELRFKVVKVELAGVQEIIATSKNLIVAGSAFDTSIALWPLVWIELRQGARLIDRTAPQTGNKGTFFSSVLMLLLSVPYTPLSHLTERESLGRDLMAFAFGAPLSSRKLRLKMEVIHIKKPDECRAEAGL
jgi:hypothetical protein